MCVLELAVKPDTLEICHPGPHIIRFSIGGACKTCGYDIAGDVGSSYVWLDVCWRHGARASNFKQLFTRMYCLGHWWLCSSLVYSIECAFQWQCAGHPRATARPNVKTKIHNQEHRVKTNPLNWPGITPLSQIKSDTSCHRNFGRLPCHMCEEPPDAPLASGHHARARSNICKVCERRPNVTHHREIHVTSKFRTARLRMLLLNLRLQLIWEACLPELRRSN